MCGSLDENAKRKKFMQHNQVKSVFKEVKKMAINLNQTIIWSPQGNKYTSGHVETHYDIENDKTTQWHEREREEREKKSGGGGRQDRNYKYYEQD